MAEWRPANNSWGLMLKVNSVPGVHVPSIPSNVQVVVRLSCLALCVAFKDATVGPK